MILSKMRRPHLISRLPVASAFFSKTPFLTDLAQDSFRNTTLVSVPFVNFTSIQTSLVDNAHKNQNPPNRLFSLANSCSETIFNIANGGSQGDSSDEIYTTDTECLFQKYQRVYIAVGSNEGDRFGNIMSALRRLGNVKHEEENNKLTDGEALEIEPVVKIVRTSFLYESSPMYVTDQASFFNGVVEIETRLSPHLLLTKLKEIELLLGRDLNNGIRNGPRKIDLDILFYGVRNSSKDSNRNIKRNSSMQVKTSRLSIPHERIGERDFVLSPLCDLDRDIVHPITNTSVGKMMSLLRKQQIENVDKKENADKESFLERILPLPRGRLLKFNETIVMGVLNVTPDSFSDGGHHKGSVDSATAVALKMIEDGAGIIDIGGESTRPGAREVAIEEELQRTLPVIRSIRQVSDVPISIDTRHALVAKAAVQAGADIVNDVSGGRFDLQMLPTVSQLQVPIVLMHSRGTPETMQSMVDYDDIVIDVASSLMECSLAAENAGISRWLQILDPGIGFAKNIDQNLSLLKHSPKLRSLTTNIPFLFGASRKGFIGKISGESRPEERDFGTVTACVFGVGWKQVPTVVRVHNVKGLKQAMMVMDSILKAA